MNEPVSSIMSTELITVKPSDSVDVIRQLFSKRKMHHVPVVEEDGSLAGLITTSDLFWLNRSFDDFPNIKVSEIMSTKLAKLEPTAKIGTVAELFLKNWFHAVPVVDQAGILIGLVTTFDLLKYNYIKAYPGDQFPFL